MVLTANSLKDSDTLQEFKGRIKQFCNFLIKDAGILD